MPAAQSPEEQLDSFIVKYTPEIGALAREVIARMRKRLPGAYELVYDNYNALVVAFAATERVSGVIFSIAAYPRWLNLYFVRGHNLPDPQRLLKGSGTAVRRIQITDASILDDPAVKDLMKEALARADQPISRKTNGLLIIKSVSARQRPRRPAI